MERIRQLIAGLDRWQAGHRWAAVAWALQRKFGDDQTNLLVVALGWYGFTAIYPLLLAVVTVLGFIGVRSLGARLVTALHHFPVVGQQFSPGSRHALHGSVLGLVIGLVGLVYGAQGVTQTAQTAMDRVWNVPQLERPGFLPGLLRSLGALATIGGAFLVNALAGGLATSSGTGSLGERVGIIAGQLAVNVGLYLLSFRLLLAPKAQVPTRRLLPGAALGAVAFTALITAGTGLIEHQLRNDSATYGAFASVIGVVTFLLLLAKLTMYAAELNPVLAHRLYPRALPTAPPRPADDRARPSP